jgi:hypothetical protein
MESDYGIQKSPGQIKPQKKGVSVVISVCRKKTGRPFLLNPSSQVAGSEKKK